MTESSAHHPTSPSDGASMPIWPLFVTSLAGFAVFLDTTILFVAFPDINRSFADVAPEQLSWVLNGYTIVFAALLVPLGKLADRLGHRRLFLLGSAGFTVASLLCAMAPDPWTLIAARVLQAAAGAALVPASLALVLRATPRQKIPVTLAIWGATGAVAGAVGPTIGALLVEAGGWRLAFVANLPIGAFTVWHGRRVLEESRDPDTVLPDPLGIGLLVTGAVLVTLGLVRGESWGWASPATSASLVAGLAVLTAFVAHQSRTRRPTMDLRLFRSWNYSWANASTLIWGTAFSAMFLSSILFLTDVWGYSILRAGLGISPGPASVAVLAPFMGRLAGRYGQRPLLVAGGVLYALAGVWRLWQFDAQPDYVGVYLPTVVLSGLGVALCLPQLSSVVGQSLPPGLLGVGGGVNQAMRQLGGTAGVALTIAFLSDGAVASSDDVLARFDRTWWITVVGGLAVAALSLPLRTSQRSTTVATSPPTPVPTPVPTVGD